MPSVAPRAASELPDIDDRLVEPQTRQAHTGPHFEAAAELLTRTSKVDDFAPDISVYPDAPDPRTRGRQLEQLVFEIASTQSLGKAGKKAAKLAGRGVRRVFAIDVERSRALEWLAALGTWRELDPAGHIEDPALAVPLPVNALIHAAKADDAVQRALIAKGNPVLEAHVAEHREQAKAEGVQEGRARGKAEGIQEGRTRGKAEALLAVLAARGVILGDTEHARILDERDPGQLDRWLARAATCTEAGELFTVPTGG